MKKDSCLSILANGILKENPVLVLILGTCPTLATTTNVFGAFGMGIAALLVLVCSNVLISLLRKVIPDNVRIPCYIVIIAGFVTVVQMVVHAFLPELYEMLGVYLALITTNCAVLGTANEVVNDGLNILQTVIQSVSVGLGFTLALILMAGVRERIDNNPNIPKCFKGLPIALITAALMAMAFAGFGGFEI